MPFSPIQEGKHHIQYSDIPGEVISPAGLKAGEMAFNVADGKMYMRAAGGNLLTFTGAPSFSDDAQSFAPILGAYVENVLWPSVTEITPVTTALTTQPFATGSVLRCIPISNSVLIGTWSDNTDKKIVLFDIENGTVIKEEYLGTGSVYSVYDHTNKLYVVVMPNVTTKAMDHDGNVYTFATAAVTHASSQFRSSPSGLIPGSDWNKWLNYETAVETTVDYATNGILTPDGGFASIKVGYYGNNYGLSVFDKDLNVVRSWPDDPDLQWNYTGAGSCFTGDFTAILAQSDSGNNRRLANIYTGEVVVGVGSEYGITSLSDAGYLEIRGSGEVKRHRRDGTAGPYEAITGDLTSSLVIAYLPNGRILVRQYDGVMGYLDVWSGVPESVATIIKQPFMSLI